LEDGLKACDLGLSVSYCAILILDVNSTLEFFAAHKRAVETTCTSRWDRVENCWGHQCLASLQLSDLRSQRRPKPHEK
jgi:hypothetical protein